MSRSGDLSTRGELTMTDTEPTENRAPLDVVERPDAQPAESEQTGEEES